MKLTLGAMLPSSATNGCFNVRLWLKFHSPRASTQQRTGSDAHGHSIGIVVGHLVGDLACPTPTRLGGRDVAAGQPRPGAHVPVECEFQISGGFEVLGN